MFIPDITAPHKLDHQIIFKTEPFFEYFNFCFLLESCRHSVLFPQIEFKQLELYPADSWRRVTVCRSVQARASGGHVVGSALHWYPVPLPLPVPADPWPGEIEPSAGRSFVLRPLPEFNSG